MEGVNKKNMRLIDANALTESWDWDILSDGKAFDFYDIDTIENAPTIDAEPVRHGHWVEMKRGHYFKCSICRNPIPYKFGWRLYNGVIQNKRYYNYCPNCGAKMDEVSE